jgi:hypothetical protein
MNLTDEQIERILLRNAQWGPIKVPESLKELYIEASDAGRDFRIIVEDRRVTDLSADYWMKEARDAKLRIDKIRHIGEFLSHDKDIFGGFPCGNACPKCLFEQAISK